MATGTSVRWTALAALALGTASASAAETRSYVVNWFYDANHYDEGACPDGLNPSAADFYRRDLTRLGMSKRDIDVALKDFPGEGGAAQPWVPLVITRGNGKDNVYANPTTAPDPVLKTVKGRYAYGFNLDGKGSGEAGSFQDPDTGEQGVDNQLYRAMGCIRSYRGLPPPGKPTQPETHWDILRELMPAWIVSVTGPEGGADGEVTVSLNRALELATRNAGGVDVQADMTFRLDPNPRTANVMKGTRRNGVITVGPTEISMVLDEYIFDDLKLSRARLRLEQKPDGTLKGLVGGYQPWYPIYYGVARSGHITEYAASIDSPGLYYALKRLADGDPDPETGQNRAISAAFHLEALPAFVAPQDLPKVAGLPGASRTARAE